MSARCINIDWLEVYVLEPITELHDVDYFVHQGFEVMQRDYGTRIYEEMFTLLSLEGYPFIEVRRRPKSEAVLPINASHIRFCNRTCYLDNAAEVMLQFIQRYHYTFVSISRLDICMDFERFDSGDDPQRFVKRYIGHKYAKINQAEASAHFDDVWERRDFNSLSWGSKKSDISTKLYNKTLELYDEKLKAYKKPYIIQAWFEAGLIDDPLRVIKKNKEGQEYTPVIWRLEFSIKSGVKGWLSYNPDGKQKVIRSVRHTLEQYLNRTMLLPVFDLLQQHYFHFKKFKQGVSKYDCTDKTLFSFSSEEKFYRVQKLASPAKPVADIMRLHRYLENYNLHQTDLNIKNAAKMILEKLERENGGRLCNNQWSADEWKALKLAVMQRLSGDKRDIMVLWQEMEEVVKSVPIF